MPQIWHYRELLWFLVLRDLKVRYKQATLGIAWALIQPVFAVAVFTVVFGFFARLPSAGVPYPIFVFSAMLPWTLFSEAVRRSSLGLVGDAALISKVYFPRMIVVLANVLSPAIDFLLGLLVLIPVAMWFGIQPTWHLALVPVLVFITTLLGLSVGLWLGPLNVRYRDIGHAIPFVLQVWMYSTPIVYPLSMVPEKWQGLYSLNPTVGLIEGFRWAVLGVDTLNVASIQIGFVVTLVLLLGGLVFFRRAERNFVDVI